MANITETNKFYFDRKNYFLRFVFDDSQLTDENHPLTSQPISRTIRHALEYFVDDLRKDRDFTIQRLLTEQSVNEIFRSLAQLLLSNEDRICGNSAFILGSLVESEGGLQKFLHVFSTERTLHTVDIIRTLCHLLTHADSECVLNAAGTLGTICSSKDGRDFLVHHACIAQLIVNTSSLLSSSNSWIASNAALVLARITVEELGCQTVLTHLKHREILNQLLSALDIHDASRSTNAAFAIGRLIEGDDGKKTLVADCGQYQIFDALSAMLEPSDEKGVNKNACYALSCLCTTSYGFQLCLQYLTKFREILSEIETILSTTEQETVWFALMCLRTIAQYDGSSEHLCYSQTLTEKLKEMKIKWPKSRDILEEAKLLWYMIHRNKKPNRPQVDDCGTTTAKISWEMTSFSWSENDENEIQYRIILNDIAIGTTNRTSYSLKDLSPNTNYNLQIQCVTCHGDSQRSDVVQFRTDDELPPAVNNLHLIRATMTAARIAWDMPDLSACNSFKGYQVYLDEIEYECTTECGITISSLSASTGYQVDVCAVTNKGKGPRTSVNFTTASAGDSLPPPPVFSVVGRREAHIKWQPPEVISGRLTRYELICNGRCIYSGTDQEYHATMLKSDTEYTMEVIVITNEGRFRSRPAKTRTLKDEYSTAHRQSLYETPVQSSPKFKRTEPIQTISSAGTNNSGTYRKLSNANPRHLSRDVTVPNRTVEMSSVRSLQLKSTIISSNNRSLPSLFKNSPPARPSAPIPARSMHRSRTDHQQQSQSAAARITASIIVPTLSTDNEPQVRWALPMNQKQPQPTTFRLGRKTKTTHNSSTIMNRTRSIERNASSSLPDLPSVKKKK